MNKGQIVFVQLSQLLQLSLCAFVGQRISPLIAVVEMRQQDVRT